MFSTVACWLDCWLAASTILFIHFSAYLDACYKCVRGKSVLFRIFISCFISLLFFFKFSFRLLILCAIQLKFSLLHGDSTPVTTPMLVQIVNFSCYKCVYDVCFPVEYRCTKDKIILVSWWIKQETKRNWHTVMHLGFVSAWFGFYFLNRR